MDKWKILGIDKTKDKEVIKNAYRSKLVHVNPEDDSEGFMQLRNAYEEALREADSVEAEADGEEPGLILDLKALYADFDRRIRSEEWQAIFERDEFVSLDTGDASMHMVLDFLMKNNVLPHNVFKVIADTFDLKEIKGELTEYYPENFIEFILNNAAYKDSINYSLFETTDGDMDAFILTYYRLDDALSKRDIEKERAIIEEIEQFGIRHPYVEICKLCHALHEINIQAGSMEERTGKYAAEIERLQRQAEEILDRYPEETYFMLACGDFAMAREAYDDAEKYYEMAKAAEPDSYTVMGRMGDLYCAIGEYEKSRDVFMDMMDINSYDEGAIMRMMRANEGLIEKLTKEISDNPEDEKLKLQLTWCYYRNNLFDDAAKVLEAFTPSDENKCEYYNLLGRNYLYTKRYEKALECFFIWKDELEALPEKDKPEEADEKRKRKGQINYYSACYFIADSYLRMKNYDEARKYLELSLSGKHALVQNAHVAMCQLEYECENYDTCISNCEAMLTQDENYYAYLYMAKSFYMLDEYGRAMNACEHAILLYPYAFEPYEVELAIFWDCDRDDDMKSVLERFDGLGGKNDRTLMWRARMLGLEKDYAGSNELLLELLEREDVEESDLWDDFDVYALLGTNYNELGEDEQTLHYYLEALKCDSQNKNLMCRIAGIYHVLGEFETGISYYEKVLALADDERYRKRAYMGKAAALSCMGDFDRAKAVYEACEAEFGLDDNYVLDHAELFVRMNNLPGCVELLERCIRELGDSSLVQYCIGNLCCFYGNQGHIDDAYRTFQLALEHKPDDYLIYRSMGLVYLDHAMYEQAREMFAKALELDTENDSYTCGPYLMAINKLDDVTKPEYQKYIDIALKQVADADDTYTYIRKAEVYLGLKKYDEALRAIDAALSQKRDRMSVFTESHSAWYVKGDIYADMGENEKAVECYKRALAVFGHDALYEEKIKKYGRAHILLAAINAKYIHSNLAVYSMQAYAKKQGQCAALAEYTINQQFEVVLRDIYNQKPDVLCFSCYIWNIEYVRELAVEFHKLMPEVPIWLGGPEVSFQTEEFLENNPAVTGVMVGEGEKTFSLLCRHYQGGAKSDKIALEDIAGIVWRDENGKLHVNPGEGLIDMDELPFCYESLKQLENRIIYYESSRGCPFSCSYCLSSVDRQLRLRSLALVYSELQFFLDNRVPQVKFVDRTFNCNHEHALGIWKYIQEHDNGVTNFHFEVSADLLNDEELALLAAMRQGLVQLEIGVQSTNQDTIQEIRRVMNLERLKDVVQRIKAGGNIHQHLDLIAGLPYEGYDSFCSSFDEIYRLKPEQLQLGFLKVLKGSHMYDMAESYGMVYRDKPPYEVMATKWLSYEELLRIKLVEEMLEIHYNSGQFLRTLAVLERQFDSPFDMYLKLADFYRENGLEDMNYTRLARAEILYRFAFQTDSAHENLYGETLLFDLYIREKAKARPKWAPEHAAYNRQIGQTLRNLGYEKKYCHVEMFHYAVYDINPWEMLRDVAGIAYNDEPQWILFNYENRDSRNHEAEVEKVNIDKNMV